MYNIILENEKINHNPLVLGYKFFKVVKHKTDVKGFWIDKGKVYIDNIDIVNIPFVRKDYLHILKTNAFNNGELAIFYKNIFNEGTIENNKGDKTILKNRVALLKDKLNIKEIKNLLKQYDGLTIYRINKGYLIEIYK